MITLKISNSMAKRLHGKVRLKQNPIWVYLRKLLEAELMDDEKFAPQVYISLKIDKDFDKKTAKRIADQLVKAFKK